MPDGRRPAPGGWNRIEFVVNDIAVEVERLRAAGLKFRNDVVTGPGGSQIVLEGPSGNPIELFQPASAYLNASRAVVQDSRVGPVDLAARRSSYCSRSGPDEEVAMKYIMLIYQGDALERQAALPEEEQKQVYADYEGINQTPGVTPGLPMGLPQNATTVRVEGGKTLTTDGPFVGMKEAVGGWFILEADDLDAAIEVAARVPAARYGGAVEIRPSEVYW